MYNIMYFWLVYTPTSSMQVLEQSNLIGQNVRTIIVQTILTVQKFLLVQIDFSLVKFLAWFNVRRM